MVRCWGAVIIDGLWCCSSRQHHNSYWTDHMALDNRQATLDVEGEKDKNGVTLSDSQSTELVVV